MSLRRLLIRPGAIGDTICSLPALESLRSSYTEVWVASPNIPLIHFADRVRSIAATGLDWLEIDPARAPSGLINHLRTFQSIVSWYGTGRDEFRSAVSRLGLPFQFLPALPHDGAVHAVDFYFEQSRALGGATVAPVPSLPHRQSSHHGIVVHPFSGSPHKNWPLDRFRAVAADLSRRASIRWVAGPEEHLEGAERFDDLGELACWLSGATLYLGNDSGISHLAAAVGAPTVVVFGPTDPRVWAPRGKAVRVVRPAKPGPISDVGVEQVLSTARDLLSEQ